MGAALPIRGDVPSEELWRLARLEADGRVACRLIALANALDGMSRDRAAKQAGMDRQTLRDWVIRFNAAGVRVRAIGRGVAERSFWVKARWQLSRPWCGAALIRSVTV